MQRVDFGVHLPQLAPGFLQLVDTILELGNARGFLLDDRADRRQVAGALLNPVADNLQELPTGPDDLLAGHLHRLTAGLKDRQVVHIAADQGRQLLTQLLDLAVFESDAVDRGGEGVGEGVVGESGVVGGRQAGFQVIEPALALQQSVLIQVERLLLGVDRVEAERDFFLGVGRTDAFEQGQAIGFQAIETHLVLQLLGFVEALRQVDRLHFLAADQVVLQQGGDEPGALGRVRETVDDRDHVGAGQGFHLQGRGRLLREGIEHGVAYRIGLQSEQVANRVGHVFANGIGDKPFERLHQQFVEGAHG
ncbi:hypothetical protein D3C84_439150 [compost metagenome]